MNLKETDYKLLSYLYHSYNEPLSKIAKEQLGAAHRWQYLYELNKDKIKDPNRLRKGQKIIIPVE